MPLGFWWGEQFPVIKKLWTSSYVLVAGGYSFLLLGGFYLIIDVWKFRRGLAPLVWIGANALTMYLVSTIVSFSKVAERVVGGEIKHWFGAWDGPSSPSYHSHSWCGWRGSYINERFSCGFD